ncbi:HIT domain-containing protein [Citricoccus alkalitolerans]|uniref:HIT family protein n=1 Tax=Citricoccus alkalitolerans TaxID=246603 RepID=A0ABV8XZX6_9MICC
MTGPASGALPDAGPGTTGAHSQGTGPAAESTTATDDFELAGTPDGFQRLWNPHRMAYVRGGQDQVSGESTCPFCAAPGRSDEQSLIVARGRTAFVLCNLYPYNAGHLLVCPYRHVPDYTDLTVDETLEIARLSQIGMTALRATAKATGFNLGMNQGKTGGAGIAAHLHQHIVPRWGGDGNFLPIIAETKNITVTLDTVRAAVAGAWAEAESAFDTHQATTAAEQRG